MLAGRGVVVLVGGAVVIAVALAHSISDRESVVLAGLALVLTVFFLAAGAAVWGRR